MEDNQIVDLYWARSEKAISETANKYGHYCYSIAYNILYIVTWNYMSISFRPCNGGCTPKNAMLPAISKARHNNAIKIVYIPQVCNRCDLRDMSESNVIFRDC